MYLNSTILKLQAVLAGAPATSQPEVHVWFYDVLSQTKEGNEEYLGAVKRTAMNGNTDVDICSAPSQNGVTRVITAIAIYNKDTASVTVTVKTDDAVTEYIIVTQVVTTLKTLCWDRAQGWYQI